MVLFFFQAEDGIRDDLVTGVQTCALPICRKFGQRFGIYDAHLRARLHWKKSFWLHAVSVGEVTIALKLARQIRILKPDQHCVLTTPTTPGFAFANQSAPDWIEVMYSPLDFWPVMP